MSSASRFGMAIAALLFAAPLVAQDVTQDTTATIVQNSAPVGAVAITAAPATEATPSLAPTATSSAVGVKRAATAAPALPMAPVERSPAMMIVGGVALIVGAVIGGTAGTIVMIGGGVLGLFGLWNYLQ